MEMSKWNRLENVMGDLNRTGGICYMECDICEMYHEHFKSHYAKTSKKDGTVMEKDIWRREEQF